MLIASMSLFHTLFVFVRCLKKVFFFLFKSSNISEQFLCVAISHFPSPWSVLLVSTLSHLFPPGHRFGRKYILFVLILSFFSSDKKKYSQFHLWSDHFRQCQHGWSALDPIIFLQCFEKKKFHFLFHIWSTLCPFFTSLYNALKSFPKL